MTSVTSASFFGPTVTVVFVVCNVTSRSASRSFVLGSAERRVHSVGFGFWKPLVVALRRCVSGAEQVVERFGVLAVESN